MNAHRVIVHHRSIRFFLALSLALIALLSIWAIAYAYSTTNDFPQCSDQNNSGTQCKWVNGQMSNAYWREGEAVPQRAYVAGISAADTDAHSFSWSVQWSTAGDHHGYDWLTSYDQAQQLHQDYAGLPLDLNLCTNNSGALEDGCVALHTTGYSTTIVIPDDNFESGIRTVNDSTLSRIQVFEALYGERTLTLWTDQPLEGTPVLTYYHAHGNPVYTPITNGGDIVGGDTIIRYTLYFTSSTDAMMLEYAAHFALSGDPTVNPMAWGVDPINHGYGAGGIFPAASWHVKDFTMDAGVGNVGSQDNQAKVNVLPTAITLSEFKAENTVDTLVVLMGVVIALLLAGIWLVWKKKLIGG